MKRHSSFENGADTGKTTTIERQHAALDLTIDTDTAVSLWQGEACDYDLAVEALPAMDEVNESQSCYHP